VPEVAPYEAEQLAEAVSEVLFREWDPIGVNDNKECRDEYDSYVPGVCRLLREGADEYRIAAHLEPLARVSIGLTRKPEHHRKVTRRILTLTDRS
jgi:hypothetical protein